MIPHRRPYLAGHGDDSYRVSHYDLAVDWLQRRIDDLAAVTRAASSGEPGQIPAAPAVLRPAVPRPAESRPARPPALLDLWLGPRLPR